MAAAVWAAGGPETGTPAAAPKCRRGGTPPSPPSVPAAARAAAAPAGDPASHPPGPTRRILDHCRRHTRRHRPYCPAMPGLPAQLLHVATVAISHLKAWPQWHRRRTSSAPKLQGSHQVLPASAKAAVSKRHLTGSEAVCRTRLGTVARLTQGVAAHSWSDRQAHRDGTAPRRPAT